MKPNPIRCHVPLHASTYRYVGTDICQSTYTPHARKCPQCACTPVWSCRLPPDPRIPNEPRHTPRFRAPPDNLHRHPRVVARPPRAPTHRRSRGRGRGPVVPGGCGLREGVQPAAQPAPLHLASQASGESATLGPTLEALQPPKSNHNPRHFKK